MNSIVEHVAKAICSTSDEYCFWKESMNGGPCVTCEGQARAAIAAMREPTKTMVNVAFDGPTFQSASEIEIADCWRLMIDSALKE